MGIASFTKICKGTETSQKIGRLLPWITAEAFWKIAHHSKKVFGVELFSVHLQLFIQTPIQGGMTKMILKSVSDPALFWT